MRGEEENEKVFFILLNIFNDHHEKACVKVKIKCLINVSHWCECAPDFINKIIQ